MTTQAHSISPGRTSSLDMRGCGSVQRRLRRLVAGGHLPPSLLQNGTSVPAEIERLSENVIGTYDMPVGVADHFIIDGRETPVFMVTQERTVIAAASSAAKRCRATGGFRVQTSDNMAQCQIAFQCRSAMHAQALCGFVSLNKKRLLAQLMRGDRLLKHGGGSRGISHVSYPDHMVELTLDVAVAQSMGANAVTRLGERLATLIESEVGDRRLMAIVTNCFQGVPVTVNARWPLKELAPKSVADDRERLRVGREIAEKILLAQRFAWNSDKRAVTHNKGGANGICAVARATGQDEEAIMASYYASASIRGSETPIAPLTGYSIGAGALRGEMRVYLPIGVVGGATQHPAAVRHRNGMGADNVRTLAGIMAAAGLASNLAALRSLVTDGIPAAFDRMSR